VAATAEEHFHVRIKPGEVARINSFDPKAEETLFFPRLVGG
jgi:hypothetical protein